MGDIVREQVASKWLYKSFLIRAWYCTPSQAEGAERQWVGEVHYLQQGITLTFSDPVALLNFLQEQLVNMGETE